MWYCGIGSFLLRWLDSRKEGGGIENERGVGVDLLQQGCHLLPIRRAFCVHCDIKGSCLVLKRYARATRARGSQHWQWNVCMKYNGNLSIHNNCTVWNTIRLMQPFTCNLPTDSINSLFRANLRNSCWDCLISCPITHAYWQAGESIFQQAYSNVQLMEVKTDCSRKYTHAVRHFTI